MTVGNRTYHQSRLSLGPYRLSLVPLPPPAPSLRLHRASAAPAAYSVAHWGPATVAIVGNPSRDCSGPPAPRSAPVRPLVGSPSLPSRYPALSCSPSTVSGTTDVVAKPPVYPDGLDRSGSAWARVVSWMSVWHFWCVYRSLFYTQLEGTIVLTQPQIFS